MVRYAAGGHSASCLPSTTARHHQCVCDLENPPATDPTIADSYPPSERGLTAPQHLPFCGNSTLTWFSFRVDCLAHPYQPINVLSSKMDAVLSKLDELLGKINKIDATSAYVTAIKNEVSTIRSGLSALEPRVENVEGWLSSMENRLDSTTPNDSTNLESTIAELNERTRRSKNVMVFNLVESDSGDTNCKKDHDLDFFNRLFTSLLPSYTPSIVKTFRVGRKQNGKFRPLKVILINLSDVTNIMSNFSYDRGSQIDPKFSSFKLSRDRPPREMKHLQNLNMELSDRLARGEKISQ
ncbi:hypothetical protein J6590_077331 [Homalodisca vitripennis]|nr:hypothetical protein J6590_077331 [Homalodisca vitripennis]